VIFDKFGMNKIDIRFKLFRALGTPEFLVILFGRLAAQKDAAK
jgi:hypothetical protein